MACLGCRAARASTPDDDARDDATTTATTTTTTTTTAATTTTTREASEERRARATASMERTDSARSEGGARAVSYTHLTLPTKA